MKSLKQPFIVLREAFEILYAQEKELRMGVKSCLNLFKLNGIDCASNDTSRPLTTLNVLVHTLNKCQILDLLNRRKKTVQCHLYLILIKYAVGKCLAHLNSISLHFTQWPLLS